MNFGKINLFRVVVAMALLMASHVFGISFAFAEITYEYDRIWPALKEPWYFSEPVGIAIDKDENIYVANRNIKQVQQYTPNGVFVTKWNVDAQPSGIAVDYDKNIYLTFEKGVNKIQKFTANGKLIKEWGGAETEDGQFIHAYGIAVDIEGYVYVTDKENHCVQKFTSDGEFFAKWGTEGDSEGQLKNPAGICTDNEGNVYVVDAGNKHVQIFSSEGKFIKSWGQWEQSEPTLPNSFTSPVDIAIDKSGYIYVTDVYTDSPYYKLLKFSPENKELVYAKSYKGKGWAIDAGEKLYVSNMLNYFYGVHILTTDGDLAMKFCGYGNDDNHFHAPRDVAIDSNGNIYVTDIGNSRVQKFDADGKFLETWHFNPIDDQLSELLWNLIGESKPDYDVVSRSSNSGLNEISLNKKRFSFDVCDFVDADSKSLCEFLNPKLDYDYQDIQTIIELIEQENINLELCEYFNDVSKPLCEMLANPQFDYDYEDFVSIVGAMQQNEFNPLFCDQLDPFSKSLCELLSTSGLNYDYDGFITAINKINQTDMNALAGIALDKNDNIYICDIVQGSIHKINQTTGEEEEIHVDQHGCYFPHRITFDTDGNAYVADVLLCKIFKFSSEWEFLGSWGGKGDGDGEFSKISGLATESSGNIITVDSGIDRVQIFSSEGKFIDKWGEKGFEIGNFREPSDIAIDDFDNIYILDGVNNRIQKFTSDKTFIAAWGERGTLPGQLNFPESIAVSNDGSHVCVVDMWNHRVQTFKKAERPSDTKAIIIAGHAEEPGSLSDDDLWEDTQICANFAYRTLTFQGFTRDTIYYMTPDGSLDLDDNDIMTEVDGAPSTNNLDKVKEWLNEDPKAENIVMYITDHGATDEFIMSNNETVSADYLNTWLDDVQKNITGRIIVIYDACYSGSFIPHIKSDNNKRIVIASSSAHETAKFIGEGSVSFSKYFWNQIFGGQDIKKSFIDSKTAMITHQTALMEANGDDNVNEPGDFDKVEGLYIGYPRPIASESKLIIGNAYADPNEITSGGSADLYAENINSDNVDKVWAEIIPPGEEINNTGSPVTEYPDCELEEIDNQNYKGTCDGFSVEGLHTIAIYAKDNQNNISDPTIVTVYAENPLPRKAIIVAGANQTDDLWSAVEKGVYSARKALETQGYSTENIYIMSSSAIQGIEATPVAPDLDSLEYALTDWAGQDTLEMILYFVGYGSEHGLYLNDREILSPNVLKMWLDGLEDKISEKLVVVIDACKSGVFIPGLASHTDRVVITSADAEGPAIFSPEGDVSFSQYFWHEVSKGKAIYDAYATAYIAIGVSGDQTPQFDSDGDGNGAVDKGSNLDDYGIGLNVKLASFAPSIGTVSSSNILEMGSATTIWAENIGSAGAIEKVWAMITPPKNENVQLGCDLNFFEIELHDMGNGRYENAYDGFNEKGIYDIKVYARDEYDNYSDPVKTEVVRIGLDDFEPDDLPENATVIFTQTESQEHNFYDPGDVDWVIFHAIENEVYDIKATDLGIDCDVKIEIYADGNFSDSVKEIDLKGKGEDELLSWTCPETGVYYVKLANFLSDNSGKDTRYVIEIDLTNAPEDGYIDGHVYDACTGGKIALAEVLGTGKEGDDTKSNPTKNKGDIGYYFIGLSPGTHEILVKAEDYSSITKSINLASKEAVELDFYMLSSNADPSMADINADDFIDLKDAIIALKISANIDSANCVYIKADVNNDGRIGLEDAIFVLQWIADL